MSGTVDLLYNRRIDTEIVVSRLGVRKDNKTCFSEIVLSEALNVPCGLQMEDHDARQLDQCIN
jgi:hypothetical protein